MRTRTIFIGGVIALLATLGLMLRDVGAAPVSVDTSYDFTVAHVGGPSPTGTNHAAFWVNYFSDLGHENVTCSKYNVTDTPYTMLQNHDAFIIKAGQTNYVWTPVFAGIQYQAPQDTSHIVACDWDEFNPPDPEYRTLYNNDCDGVFSQLQKREWVGDEDGDWSEWTNDGSPTTLHLWTDPYAIETWEQWTEPAECDQTFPSDEYVAEVSCVGVQIFHLFYVDGELVDTVLVESYQWTNPDVTETYIVQGEYEGIPRAIEEPETCKTPCEDTVIGRFFALIGPNGETCPGGGLASFSYNEGAGSWYLPNIVAQQKCCGFVAVAVDWAKTFLIKQDCETNKLNFICTRCTGGGPPIAYGNE